MRNFLSGIFVLTNCFFVYTQTLDLDLSLSSSNTLDIVKQNNGLIWVATDEGLNVFYDDEKYVFYSNIQDSLSLLNSKVDRLIVTSSDNLVALSQDGLSVFNSEAFDFKQIKLNSRPVSIVEDSFNSDLWVATENSGYYVISSDFKIKSHYTFDPLSPLSISTSKFSDSDEKLIIFEIDKIYIGTNNGLNIFDKKLNTFKRFFKGKKSLFTTNKLVGIEKYQDKILIATENELVLFDYKNNKFEHNVLSPLPISFLTYFSDDQLILNTLNKKFKIIINDNKVSINALKTNYIPNKKNITFSNNHIYFWDNNSNIISQTDYDFLNKKSIKVNGLLNSLKTKNNDLFIATNSGIKTLNQENSSVTNLIDFKNSDFFYSYDNQLININNNTIEIKDLVNNKFYKMRFSVDFSKMSFETDQNLIFIGNQNIHLFDITKKKFYKSVISSDLFNNYTINNLKSIDNTLYVSHDNGLFEVSKELFKDDKSSSEIIFYDFNELLNSNVPRGFMDIEKIGLYFYVTNQQSGLSIYENDFNSFVENFKFDGNPLKSLATSTPTKLLYNENEKILYVGSIGSGLFKYSLNENIFSNLNIEDGLLSNNVYDFLQFSDRLFFQSGTGINFLEHGLLKNITLEDGLSPVTFHDKSLHKINDKVVVSGKELIQTFSMESINSSNDNFSINIFNIVGIDELNKKNIVALSDNIIEVDYQTKTLSFDLYSDNSYKSNQLKYFVEKVDSKELIKNGYNNQVQLSGLPYYTSNLIFYAVNGNGVKSSNSLQISVYNAPPWWLRVESIVGYFILLIVFITFFVKYREKKTKERMEGERKTKELEEAKELQNSLLPKVNPTVPGYEISTYLKPATEIGGDYYDFFYKKDEYFYAICGDATGHGVISGIMVSVTKAGLHGIPMGDPSSILGKLNRIVKRVNFGRLRMSLSVAKFDKKSVELSSAAMPPTYFFSVKSKKLEEVLVPNLPLGGLESEIFDGVKKEFDNGDVMVMISDGLPELPNPENDLLDYEKVENCISNNAHKNANEIKEALVNLCDDWASGVMNPDDITIVVIKKIT